RPTAGRRGLNPHRAARRRLSRSNRAAPPDACAGRSSLERRSVSEVADIAVDYIEAGTTGPIVMLVHSSVSGARPWSHLIDHLKDRFRVRAVNLFGYGRTPPWPAGRMQSLDDQARLVEAALPRDAGEICLVGHSFGGTVAMKAAARLEARVSRL